MVRVHLPDTRTAHAMTEPTAPAELDLFAGIHGKSSKDIAALLENADVVAGADLLKDDEKLQLERVPFVITKVVFRDGGRVDKETKKPLDYVSVEATTGGGRDVVFNDGSTGIRRQIVNYLLAKDAKLVRVSDTISDVVNASDIFDATDPDVPIKGIDKDNVSYSADIVLVAKRGFRVSTYSNEYATDARTFYLA